uniref:YqaJ viral recombinase domain-containing protein n=1 Tax=viral metagenome TaxID=1070528 RepID=A0A6C0BJR5_9ZZZZ
MDPDINYDVNQMIVRIRQLPQIEQKTQDWYQTRRQLITATEVSTICNCAPFQTARELYYDKTHPEIEQVEKMSPEIQWGTEHEEVVKRSLQSRVHGVVINLGLATHPTDCKIGASPDGLLLETDDQDRVTHVWLVEIKCPYRRRIASTIPYYYWLQIQTQLYVWTPLLARLGLTLEGCYYSDNQFTDVHTFLEQRVTYQSHIYETQILPQIHTFLQLIHINNEGETDDESVHPRKRQKKNVDSLQLYSQYLDPNTNAGTNVPAPPPHHQKHYRRAIDHDLLLDWLDLYGDCHQKDPSTSISTSWTQIDQFKKQVVTYLKSQLPTNAYLDLQSTSPSPPASVDQKKSQIRGLSYDDLSRTLNSLETQVPVIFHATLYDASTDTLGIMDLLIQMSWFQKLFPTAWEKISLAKLPRPTSTQYTLVQFRYNRLKLCAKTLYLLNSSCGQKEAKMECVHLLNLLHSHPIGLECTSYGWVMGYQASSLSKGVKTDINNAIKTLGLVCPETHDISYVTQRREYLTFLTELQIHGAEWSIDPPSRPELFPNMKNGNDSPWSQLKKQLAIRQQDLTLMWNLGPGERQRMGIIQWTQLTEQHLEHLSRYQPNILNMVESNLHQRVINLDQIQPERHTVEFYLDFEFINHMTDTSQFPTCYGVKYIYMTGCLCVNRQRGTRTYHNYLINRLDHAQEKTMLQEWWQDVMKDNQVSDHPQDVYLTHWGNCEKYQIETYLRQQLQISMNQVTLHFTDLCELFKTEQVAIPGAFSYNLKDVAKALYHQHMIATTWEGDMTGDNSVTSIQMAEQECQQGHYTRLCEVPIMNDVIRYNYVDCKVLEEIVHV